MKSRSRVILVGLLGSAVSCWGEGGDRQTASTVEPPRTADTAYAPAIPHPAYTAGHGPTVCVDEAHNNFHTAAGTYAPFATVLRTDGYVVERLPTREPGARGSCDVLVIADAQPPSRASEPPTFTDGEIVALNRWVGEGGSLLLITDHLPDPGAVEGLAASFGIEVHDGYVFPGSPEGASGILVFRASDGTLAADPLLGEPGTAGEVAQVATFLGAALRGPEGFRSLLILGPGHRSWAPEEYYGFRDDTPWVDVAGWSQGGVLPYGAGRVAVFGEAAMFTAQVFDGGRTRVGMNAPDAVGNLRLLLNVMGWLTHLGEPA